MCGTSQHIILYYTMEKQLEQFAEQLLPWLLSHGVKILFIIAGSVLLSIILKRVIIRIVRMAVVPDKNEASSATAQLQAELKRENTLILIFVGIMRISIILIASMMVLSEMGLMIGPILAGAGIIGLAVGFGGQYLIRDIISGLFIIIENQYRVGDVVNFDGTGGFVENISLRMTTLRDMDGTVHHIPHGEINKTANLTKHFSRVNMNVRISYKADLHHVIEIINKTGKELAEDIKWKEFITKAPQFLRVDDFGESAIIVKILGDTLPIKQWDVSGELRLRLKLAFDREGIEIPLPQLTVSQAK